MHILSIRCMHKVSIRYMHEISIRYMHKLPFTKRILTLLAALKSKWQGCRPCLQCSIGHQHFHCLHSQFSIDDSEALTHLEAERVAAGRETATPPAVLL